MLSPTTCDRLSVPELPRPCSAKTSGNFLLDDAPLAAAGVNWVFDQTFDEGQPALLEAVKLCVELGMDVNAVNSMGLTALHGAANRGSDEIIRYLVQQGAKVDVKDAEGRTPLTWAEGVFLATHPARPKPSSIELLKQLASTSSSAAAPAKP